MEDLTRVMLHLSRIPHQSLREMGQRSQHIIDDFSLTRWASEVARIAEA